MIHWTLKKSLTNIAILLTGLLFAVNALSYLARFHYGFELLTHFRFQYLWLFALSALFFLLVFNKKWLVISLLGLILNAVPVLSFCCYSIKPAAVTSNKASLLLSNVQSSNRHYQYLLDRIATHKPDFIVLLEFSPDWANALIPLDEHYPFQKLIPRNDNFGIALFSKFPLSNVEVKDFAQNGIPSIVATAQLFNQTLRIIATHPLPPMNSTMAAQQEQHLENLAAFINKDKNSASLLAGDFNSTPFSPRYKKLIKETGLINSRQGKGLYPSWPSNLVYKALQIPLDHVLISKGIQSQSMKRLESIGSDHYPILFRFGR